jgi:hypothetical protein
MVDLTVRYLGGDKSLAPETDANANSNAGICQAARKQLASEGRSALGGSASVPDERGLQMEPFAGVLARVDPKEAVPFTNNIVKMQEQQLAIMDKKVVVGKELSQLAVNEAKELSQVRVNEATEMGKTQVKVLKQQSNTEGVVSARAQRALDKKEDQERRRHERDMEKRKEQTKQKEEERLKAEAEAEAKKSEERVLQLRIQLAKIQAGVKPKKKKKKLTNPIGPDGTPLKKKQRKE